MSTLTSRRIRAIADTAKFDGPTATATNAQLRMWNGSPTRFEWRFDYSGSLVTDLSNVTEMTMQIKASADGRAPADAATPLVSKTITTFDATLDSGSWADGSKQHAAFTLTGAEANVGVGKCWIVIVASLSGIADPVTLCAGPLDVVGDGYDSGAGAPPTPAASYLNTSQSDARYLQLTGGTIAGNLNVTGNTTLGDAAGDSATINAGTVTAPNATNLALERIANVGALCTAFPRILFLDNAGSQTQKKKIRLTVSCAVAAFGSFGHYFAGMHAHDFGSAEFAQGTVTFCIGKSSGGIFAVPYAVVGDCVVTVVTNTTTSLVLEITLPTVTRHYNPHNFVRLMSSDWQTNETGTCTPTITAVAY